MDIATIYRKYFKDNNVVTDTRKVKKGDIFIALRGENFDGNLFAAEALEQGAVIAVVDNQGVVASGEKYILVENSLHYLQQLARHHRRALGIPVLGITGSNGKTTTKELIRAVLERKYACESTQGNLNNHIGVPITLLSFDASLDLGIVEMGANHIGEIAELCAIAEPNSGLITNIGQAHLEGFGSFEGVVRTKSELYESLKKNNGTIYVNASDQVLMRALGSYGNLVKYNVEAGICYARIIRETPTLYLEIFTQHASTVVNTSLYGAYNITNILAAAAIGLHLDVSLPEIKAGIEGYTPRNNRSEQVRHGTNLYYFDCYNANPSSMYEALMSFHKLEADNKYVILGEMKELGQYAAAEHQKLVRLARELSFNKIILVGSEFNGIEAENALRFTDVDDLLKHHDLSDIRQTAILIKGSRSNRLERIKDLLDQPEE